MDLLGEAICRSGMALGSERPGWAENGSALEKKVLAKSEISMVLTMPRGSMVWA